MALKTQKEEKITILNIFSMVNIANLLINVSNLAQQK